MAAMDKQTPAPAVLPAPEGREGHRAVTSQAWSSPLNNPGAASTSARTKEGDKDPEATKEWRAEEAALLHGW